MIPQVVRIVFGSNFPVLATTATATDSTAQEIETHLSIGNCTSYRETVLRKNLRLEVYAKKKKMDEDVDFIVQTIEKGSSLRSHQNSHGLFLAPCKVANEIDGLPKAQTIPCAIIYALTVKNTEALYKRIKEKYKECGLLSAQVRMYHGRMKDGDRKEVLQKFKSGLVNIVVATTAFGLGINRKDIRFVFHYSLPKSVESYCQEFGRAGRDGNPARCILLWNRGDLRTLQFFINNAGESLLKRANIGQKRDREGFSTSSTFVLDDSDSENEQNQSTSIAELEVDMDKLRKEAENYKNQLTDKKNKILFFACQKKGCRWVTVAKYFSPKTYIPKCKNCDLCCK